MKIKLLLLPLSLAALLPSQAQQPPETNQDYSIVERGQDYRVFQKTIYETGPAGQVVPRIHRYTELGTGMHFLKNGAWTESSEQIALLPDGSAAATNGPHQVFFPPDIFQGTIACISPEGLKLQSQPALLAYFDGSNIVELADITNSVGLLMGSGNQIIYTNCFTYITADLLVTYKKSGYECDLVFRSAPPPPDAFGMDPDATSLQLFTQFFDTPEPIQEPGATGPGGLQDSTLTFGPLKMISGQAFAVGQPFQAGTGGPFAATRRGSQIFKSWAHLNNRVFLVEEIPYRQIESQFSQLALADPPARWFASSGTQGTRSAYAAAASIKPAHLDSSRSSRREEALKSFPFFGSTAAPAPPHSTPDTRPAPEITNHAPVAPKLDEGGSRITLAQAPLTTKPGLYFPFQAVNAAQTNFVFQSDTTYAVSSNWLLLFGTTTVEGGTVIKVTNGNPATISLRGSLVCSGSPYKMSIFTSINDNSVGETLPGSTGSPSTVNAYYLEADGPGVAGKDWLLQYVRMSYALVGFIAYDGLDVLVRDCQFVNGAYGACSAQGMVGNITVQNTLFAGVTNPIAASSNATAINVTADRCTNFVDAINSLPAVTLTNCLLTSVTNVVGWEPGSTGTLPTPVLDHSINLPSSNGVFQTVGAASYLLCADSTNRNVGTTNIDPTLLTNLQLFTTYPPIVLSNLLLTVPTTFSPQAQRDNGDATLDLGVHYAPLDYALCEVIAVAPVTINPGTAVAMFGGGFNQYGLSLNSGSQLLCQGLANNRIWIVEFNTVQEQPGSGWTIPNWNLNYYAMLQDGAAGPTINCRFTDWSIVAQDTFHTYLSYIPANFQDCQFHGGVFVGLSVSPLNLTNDLFERVYTYLQPAGNAYQYGLADAPLLRNNLFYGGRFEIDSTYQTNAVVKDNLFDKTTITNDEPGWAYDGGHNAFVTNYSRLQPTFASDIILSNSIPYQAGPLGNFYQPSNSPLINIGSTNANLVALYQYTVMTNLAGTLEIKETNSIVDVGYHYVAVDANGNPIDSNGNGIPDYLEDSSGTGILGPVISLTAPTNNALYAEPATILLQALVSDWSSIVTNVEFYAGSTGIAGITNSPYQFTWPIVPAGHYALSATASDTAGLSSASQTANVVVTNACSH